MGIAFPALGIYANETTTAANDSSPAIDQVMALDYSADSTTIEAYNPQADSVAVSYNATSEASIANDSITYSEVAASYETEYSDNKKERRKRNKKAKKSQEPELVAVTDSTGQVQYVTAADSVDTAQWPIFEKEDDGSSGITVESLDDTFNETEYYRGRKPDADKAVWFSAVLPGLGQIYNRQYWKLPIIVGGALGCAYAITWNNRMYVDYRKAYLDLIDSDPDTRYYENLLPDGVEITSSNQSTYERTFSNGQETYLRYRDLSIIVAGALYLLAIIDAYVDAHLFDYDISPDLNFNVGPAVIPGSNTDVLDASVGFKCKLRF